jgi:hypothetical protein
MVAKVLLLVQHKNDVETRRYQEFAKLDMCLDYVLKIFEDKLRTHYSEKDNFTYDLSELYEYLDELPQIICMIFSEDTRNYTPHDKNWIKSKLYQHLTTQLNEISFE